MARDEHDREDLLREATALVDRGEFVCPNAAEPVVVGFRREGAASFFLGPQRVLHFNSRGELRRAYWAGALYKSGRRRLIRLTRQRTKEAVELLRHDLTDAEIAELLAAMRAALVAFQAELTLGHCQLRQQVGDAKLLLRIQAWLAASSDHLRLADSPHVG